MKDQIDLWRRKAGLGDIETKEKDQWREESAQQYSAKGWLTFQICPFVPH